MKTKSNILFAAIIIAAGLFACPLFAQDNAKDLKAEFDAAKAEWEKVRDQQIALIQEKEAQLEELKEELFRKISAGKDAGSATQGGISGGRAVSEAMTPILQPGTLERRMAELKEANRLLSEENSELRAKNLELEAAARATLDGSNSAMSDLLKKQRTELEAQQAAFLKERQKFFREMNRQKAKLWAAQSLSKDDAVSGNEGEGTGNGAV